MEDHTETIVEENLEPTPIVEVSKYKQFNTLFKTKTEQLLNNCRRNNRSLLFSFLAVAITSCILTFSISHLHSNTYLTTVTSQHSYTPTIPSEKPSKPGVYQNNTSQTSTNEDLTQSQIEQILKYYFKSSQGSTSGSENEL